MTRSIAVVFPQWMQEHGEHGEEHAFITFEHVVRALAEVSPLVEVESVGVVVMAARGPSKYFGGDAAVARHLHGVCEQVANQSAWGIGIADSRFAATAAAHLAHSRRTPCVVRPDITSQFIGALPTASLLQIGGISEDTTHLLQRLGLRTCDAVFAIGESALIDRFGIEGKRIYALVSGGEVRHFAPGLPPSDFATAIESEEPLTSAAHVVNMVNPAVLSLTQAISSHGQQCVRLLITCETDHAESISRIWGEPRGFGAAGISQRLMYQLEGWLTDANAVADAPTSGVVRVAFEPLECREVMVSQPLLWGGHQENTERAARAVSMAMAVSADVEVTVPRWEGGRDVVTAYSHVPVSLVDLTDSVAAEQRVLSGKGVARDWSGEILAPSPASVAPRVVPIQVLDAQGKHVSVTGRHELSAVPATVHVGNAVHTVLRVGGPWPVEERWWDPLRRRRHVRVQVLVRQARNVVTVLLVALENQQWTLVGRYD